MIYLDYSATTPVNQKVLEIFNKVSNAYVGNPNSNHKLGVIAKEAINNSTKRIANILNVKEKEIIYTSGATESNNTAIKGVCLKNTNIGKHIITTKLEHSSVIASVSYLMSKGYEVDFVNIKEDGLVDLVHLKQLLRNDTVLVSIASVNSEVGISEPINEIARIVKENSNAIIHSDITQSIGKQPIDLSNIDLASLSAQKIYGLKGIGLLVKKENIEMEPLIHGGKSTTPFRSGTPSTGLICSLGEALSIANKDITNNYEYVQQLNQYLKNELSKIKSIHINSTNKSIPHILNISVTGIEPDVLQHKLEEKDIYVSTQTACSVGKVSASVYAITKNEEYATHSIRISLSYLTTKSEVKTFVKELISIIEATK